MKLINDIPDRFWGLFRSVNRSAYIEALLKINEEYEYSNYFLSQEMCIQILADYFAKRNCVIWRDEMEEEKDTRLFPSSSCFSSSISSSLVFPIYASGMGRMVSVTVWEAVS